MKLRYGLLLIPISALVFGSAACGGSDEDDGGGSGGTSAGGSGGSGGGGDECKPTAASCYVSGADGPGNECLALADNSGAAKAQLRLSQFEVTAPAVLSQPFMQDSIVTKKVTLSSSECNQFGDGQFNVLLEFDEAGSMMTLGTAPPHAVTGSINDGTCYGNFTDPSSGLEVGPVETAATYSGSDVSANFDAIALPIYLDDNANSDGSGQEHYALLPMNAVELTATLSGDKNCIGRYRYEALDPSQDCAPAAGEFAWENGGTLDGYVTVVEADTVFIESLAQTLCVLLSGDTAKWKGPDGDCKSSDAFAAEGYPVGDWCSTDNSAGSCQDAWHIETKFAASAVNITGTCQ